MTNNLKISGLLVLLVICFLFFNHESQVNALNFSDTSSVLPQDIFVQENEDTIFKAGLATMTVFFLIGFCILTIIGVAIATVFILAILGLGFAGIFSTSIIYGLYKRSLEKTFKTFIVLSFALGGLLCCSIAFPILNKILRWTEFENALLAGLLVGVSSGLLTGLVGFKILKTLTKASMDKLGKK